MKGATVDFKLLGILGLAGTAACYVLGFLSGVPLLLLGAASLLAFVFGLFSEDDD